MRRRSCLPGFGRCLGREKGSLSAEKSRRQEKYGKITGDKVEHRLLREDGYERVR